MSHAVMYRFEQTAEFFACSADGRSYHVIEYTKLVNLADAHTPHCWEAVGPKEYWVRGERVKRISETEFLVGHPRRGQTTVRIVAPS